MLISAKPPCLLTLLKVLTGQAGPGSIESIESIDVIKLGLSDLNLIFFNCFPIVKFGFGPFLKKKEALLPILIDEF